MHRPPEPAVSFDHVNDAYRSPAARDTVHEWCTAALAGWGVGHESRTLEVPVHDTTVSTHVVAVGEGPPRLVWLPGTAMSAASSLDEIGTLAEHGTVWALDLPGQPGLSDPTRPRRDTTAWYSTWLEAALHAITLEWSSARELTLVGSGLGAAVCLSADSPVVTGRFLVGPGGLVPPRTSASQVRDRTRWSLRSTPVTARAVLGHLVEPGGAIPDTLVEWLALVGRTCKTINHPRPLPQHYLDRIDGAPLTVVVGEDDTLVPPPALSATVARRTSATVVVVDGCGHLLPPERWEQVLRVLPA